ncbi:hypothetical protein GGH18_002124 [Coemansia sp. RSA 530]|nr:hypothetical protein GGH18_002124 [Coemansia sp. RSA 530]
MSTRVQKAMVNPINIIFKFLQSKTRGFDEFMNVVLDDAKEIHTKKGTEKHIGRIMLKGDNITLIHEVAE